MVVTAHPDDVDFGAAGTVATWTAAGIEVSYCVCTSGEASGEAGRDAAEMARVREAEQRAAAEQVGVREVTFLGYADGAVEPSLALRRDIARVIRRVRPDRVLTWSPEINWSFIPTTHPDHRAVGAATFAAVYPDARNPHAFPELLADEGLEPWSVPELWLADGPVTLRNHAVDVTAYADKKLAALRSHVSQVGAAEGLEENIRAYLAGTASRYGMADGRLAEDFQVVDTG
ncbi:PIG-L family deacetylase [Actinophytocola sp. S1-96]|uniref:PIG-L family deacetylase n=1 Tax=Actinophytocola gossypii TaxID=2812003 RepID=A0ABT2JJR1_9PSEU|nr:PIG-L family deacetylase [Actinophytocola gossypii]